MKLALTDLALKDLASIEEYTRMNWGEKKADVYIDLLEQAISNILTNPEIGVIRPDIAENSRYLPEQSHLIFYRIAENEIVILAIPHSSMAIDKYLEREDENKPDLRRF